MVKKQGFSVTWLSKPNEVAVVAETLEPNLLNEVVAYVVRTRPGLQLQ